MLRFHSPLIEPGGRFSRTGLSDKNSCVRPGKALRPGTRAWKASFALSRVGQRSQRRVHQACFNRRCLYNNHYHLIPKGRFFMSNTQKLNIGIIGTGHIGTTLVRKLTRVGHAVRMANSRGPETLAELAEENGAQAVTAEEAVQGGDVVILSIPLNKLSLMKQLLAQLPDGVIVADTSNYYPLRDGSIPALDSGGLTESEWVSEQIGHPVIKAWNNVLAGTFAEKGLPRGAEGRIALSVAGDDPAAKQTVLSLVEYTGFDAIDGGTLAESWRQQPGTPGYCTEQTSDELRSALAAADRTRAPLVRDEVMKEVIARDYNVTNEDILRLNRSLSA